MRHADDDTRDDVDGGDNQARNGIALNELHGTVHGTVELTFALQIRTAALGFVHVDGAGAHIGVNTHLLSRHGVQGETRTDFGNTLGTLGNDQKVDQQQDEEDDRTDDEVSADDELTEGKDDFAGVGV